jgi:glycosyltransferase involved in cell wall biosynthesis
MSVGLPIAATDIPGIRQVVGVPQFPYLAPPGDAERLADAMFTLASDPDLRHELGERNRSVVEERVTVPAAEATAAALAAALAERARG